MIKLFNLQALVIIKMFNNLKGLKKPHMRHIIQMLKHRLFFGIWWFVFTLRREIFLT